MTGTGALKAKKHEDKKMKISKKEKRKNKDYGRLVQVYWTQAPGHLEPKPDPVWALLPRAQARHIHGRQNNPGNPQDKFRRG